MPKKKKAVAKKKVLNPLRRKNQRTTENKILTAMRFVTPGGGEIENALADLVGHRGLNICFCDVCEDARASLPRIILPNEKGEE